ncbi:hypothetical protein HMPREF1544_03417 [Mucor circinelloides 1006PhL]|uniref:Uncharacterized protein n=1 Tax=Mucor circinelloides f. circinelloides (strain 1006PhL) TaxID=1220926 RepID=S2JIM0_MUCC1|nr:hypothetical protein HMPREF1544_03417 [Mucor circinelloides 1006PhL]
MNKYQTKKDMSLKRLQCLLSDVFRPLDVLGYENEISNAIFKCLRIVILYYLMPLLNSMICVTTSPFSRLSLLFHSASR